MSTNGDWKNRFEEEYKIVDRIWKALGCPKYEDAKGQTIDQLVAAAVKDATRYRWLRSERVSTEPRYYHFWTEFENKLCREEKLDALIDKEMPYGARS